MLGAAMSAIVGVKMVEGVYRQCKCGNTIEFKSTSSKRKKCSKCGKTVWRD